MIFFLCFNKFHCISAHSVPLVIQFQFWWFHFGRFTREMYIMQKCTRLKACFMFIPIFLLRDKVTLRLLKLCLCIADMAEWFLVLDIRLRDWCWSLLSAQKFISNTVRLNFQTYINMLKIQYYWNYLPLVVRVGGWNGPRAK